MDLPAPGYNSTEPAQIDKDAAFKAKRARILTLVFAVCFVDGADVQLLPASFRSLEASLGFDPMSLGKLSLAQSIASAVFAPVWGSLCDAGLSTKWLLMAGVTAWGVLTIVLSTVSAFWAMLVLRGLIGVALASLLPITQVVIAGLAGPVERGHYFGWAGMSQMSGQVVSQLITTSVSNMKFQILGFSIWGWRISFFCVGLVSIALGFVLAAHLEEIPRRQVQDGRLESFTAFFVHMFERMRVYMKSWTFCIIVFQGLFGSVPWNALNFLAMYFQYLGFKDYVAASLCTIWLVGSAIGNLLGGYVGDRLERFIKYHGRPLTGQITVFNGIPLIAAILLGVSRNASSYWWYAVLLFLLGVFSSWAGTGVKRPMLSQIIKQRDWASILAFDSALEGSSAAIFGAPVVGFLAENIFKYQPVEAQISDIPEDLRKNNVEALATAMVWTTVIPWTVCFLSWSFIHLTYPAEAKANEESLSDEEENPDSEDAPLLPQDDGCLSSN